MSSPLAIGAVSAVLRNLLDNGLIEAGPAVGGTVNVSAVAPTRSTSTSLRSSRDSTCSCYQVTPNPGWRNRALPSRAASSGERLTNAPLALDLHYLLTAYAPRRLPGRDPARLCACICCTSARCSTAPRSGARSTRVRSTSAMLPPAFQALAAVRPRRPGRADQDHAGRDGRRGNVEAVGGDPVALPAVRRLSSFRSC